MLKITYEDLTIDGLKDVLIQVGNVCKELDIDLFL